MKHCPDCKISKPETNFNKNKARKDGLGSVCRECERKRNKIRDHKNRPLITLRKRAHRQLNQEKWTKYYKEYYNKNKEHDKIRGKRARAINKIKVIEMYGGRCACCGENIITFLCMDHKNNDGHVNRECITKIYVNIIKTNQIRDDLQILCSNCNASKMFNYGICIHNLNSYSNKRNKYRMNRKKKVIELYGGKCACCGISEHDFLSIDHINNDGHNDRHSNFYQKLLKTTKRDDLQILCWNCNTSKLILGQCEHINRGAFAARAHLTSKIPNAAIQAPTN